MPHGIAQRDVPLKFLNLYIYYITLTFKTQRFCTVFRQVFYLVAHYIACPRGFLKIPRGLKFKFDLRFCPSRASAIKILD